MYRVLKSLTTAVVVISAWEVARLTSKEIKRTLKQWWGRSGGERPRL